MYITILIHGLLPGSRVYIICHYIMGCHGNHAFSHIEKQFIFRTTIGNCPGSGVRMAKLDAGVQVSDAVKVSLEKLEFALVGGVNQCHL